MVSPEEIQKEFEDFVKNRFGDRVHVIAHQVTTSDTSQLNDEEFGEDDVASETTREMGNSLRFNLKPKEVKAHLDRYVIGQDEAKRALAIGICDHYNHIQQCNDGNYHEDYDYVKQNIIISGPTGVGKTYLIRQLAKLIGVPFVKADATRFSETGYVGANVDDLIHDLVGQAGGNLDLAQYGIVYIDEADKLAGQKDRQGKEINSRGVQFGLLKLMEETEVDLRAGNDMRSQMQAFVEMQRRGKLESKIINTKHILFIVSGAFNGLEEIIAKRTNQSTIGFRPDQGGKAEVATTSLQNATTEDFVNFGFEPEFIGRLPIRVACHALSEGDLFSILQESAGSILLQYKESFAAYGIKLSFTESALRIIASQAAKEQTGARAIMNVCEKILRPFKFELPSTNINELVIDEEVVQNPNAALMNMLSNSLETKLH